MLRALPVLLFGLWSGAAAGAEWPEPAPRGPRPARVLDVVHTDDEEPPNAPLADFRTKLKELQKEREALQAERKKTEHWLVDEPASDADLLKLRFKLSGLLGQIAGDARPKEPPKARIDATLPRGKTVDKDEPPRPFPLPKTAGETPEEGASKRKEEKDDAAKPARFTDVPDPLSLANALFRAGNYRDALLAYRMLPLNTMPAPQRVPVKYQMATCLKKQGKNDEAAVLYREVANATGEEAIAVCAQWQLSMMRWQSETKSRLDGIRARRKSLEK